MVGPAMRAPRLGPIITLLIGVALHFCGYLVLWAAAKGLITPPYWVLLVTIFAACNAQTYFETGAMVTSVRNFETERHAACPPGSCMHASLPSC